MGCAACGHTAKAVPSPRALPAEGPEAPHARYWRCPDRDRRGKRRTVTSFADSKPLAADGGIRPSHSVGDGCSSCARASRHTDRLSSREVLKLRDRENGTEY